MGLMSQSARITIVLEWWGRMASARKMEDYGGRVGGGIGGRNTTLNPGNEARTKCKNDIKRRV